MNTLRKRLVLAGSIRPAASNVTSNGKVRVDPRAMQARREEARTIRAERDNTERGWFEQQVCREAP